MSAIPTGVDLERFHPRPESERRSIRASLGVRPTEDMVLFVGRLQRIKGVHVLLEAARRMPANPKVVVCGGSSEPGYEDELLRLGGNTVFLGRRHDVPELMAAADLLVLPSDCPETQGLVVHESMACGTPVVASDVGGLPASMAGFPDHLVKPADVTALSAAIDRFLHWRRDDPGLGERSREWVSAHLSTATTGDAVDAVLNRAVEARHRVATPRRPRGGWIPGTTTTYARLRGHHREQWGRRELPLVEGAHRIANPQPPERTVVETS